MWEGGRGLCTFSPLPLQPLHLALIEQGQKCVQRIVLSTLADEAHEAAVVLGVEERRRKVHASSPWCRQGEGDKTRRDIHKHHPSEFRMRSPRDRHGHQRSQPLHFGGVNYQGTASTPRFPFIPPAKLTSPHDLLLIHGPEDPWSILDIFYEHGALLPRDDLLERKVLGTRVLDWYATE